MTKKLQDIYDVEQFRKLGHQLIDRLADHHQATLEGHTKQTLPWQEPDDMLQFWQSDEAQSMTPEQLFATILERSVAIHNPRFIGHQVGMSAPISVLFGMLSSYLNNGMAVYEMGMVSNALEKQIIDELCGRMGWPSEAGGILTSGGTLASLTALLTARKLKSHLVQPGHQPALMVSEQAHYCIERAAITMGWPKEAVIQVPVDKQYSMQTSLLEDYREKARQDGFDVIAVVGSACSTSTGSYDDLVSIASFCKTHQLWFHVDAAHGGAAIFAQRYVHKLQGVDAADSLVLDFHKLLMTPALATALIYKNNQHSFQTFQQKAEYLLDLEQDWYNSGKRTFECTKYMMSVKIYSIIHTYGWEAFGENVTALYDKARTFADIIQANPSFSLATPVQSNIICFRLEKEGLSEQELNDWNANVRQHLLHQGNFYIVQTVLRGNTYLRMTVMNPFTTKEDIQQLLEAIQSYTPNNIAPPPSQ